MMIKPFNILGLYGGASLDGIKAELVQTDGVDIFHTAQFRQIPYPERLLSKIRSIIGKKITKDDEKKLIDAVEIEFSDFLDQIVKEYVQESESPIDIIGLEGPTLCHEPKNKYTYQLGKGRLLAQSTGIKVVTHFHNADILNGGQGVPITAAYYQMLAQTLPKPAAFVNLSGVTTIIFCGTLGEVYAFDCGPGTALIDDWMLKHGGVAMDYSGKCAAIGNVDPKVVAALMKHEYLAKYPPKFLNYDTFNDKIEHFEGLTLENGAATATALISEATAYSIALYLPVLPQQIVICGGGAYNPTLVRVLRQKLKAMGLEAYTAKELNMNINGAQAIAFLAARRIYLLPITFPTTTGVSAPLTGGEIYEKED